LHGGNAPQVRRSAEQRLRALADPAVDALTRALESHGPACDVCGRADGDRDPSLIRSAIAVLDRCGMGPKATLSVERAEPAFAGWVLYLPTEQLKQVGDWIEDAKARMARGEDRADLLEVPDVLENEPHVTDAVLIDEDDDA
jgi:hypothetical protein